MELVRILDGSIVTWPSALQRMKKFNLRIPVSKKMPITFLAYEKSLLSGQKLNKINGSGRFSRKLAPAKCAGKCRARVLVEVPF